MMTYLIDKLQQTQRDFNISRITDDFSLCPKLSNLVKYDNEIIERRKRIFGLPIGKKYYLKKNSIDSKYYKLIEFITSKHDVIITGSSVIRIFGLLDRELNGDVDIIASKETIDEMSKLYKEHFYGKYGNLFDGSYAKTFVIDKIKVDVFLSGKINYDIIDNVKVHNIFDLMNFKINTGRTKDLKDVSGFIKLMNGKMI